MAFLSVPAVSAVLWMTFFRAIYGIADPSAPYGSVREFSLGFIPGGLAGLLFDQRFGLVANAPVLIVGLAGLAMMLTHQQPCAVCAGLEWPGRSPARARVALRDGSVPSDRDELRHVVGRLERPGAVRQPAVLILAIPCAVAWSRMRNRGSRAVAAGLLAFTGFLSCVLIVTDGGRLAYNTRETTALWLDWASTLAPLADGIPIWFRGQEGAFAIDIGVWAVALALAWWCARALAGTASLLDRGRLLTAIAAVHIIAAMVAVTVVWRIHGAGRLLAAPAELDVLRSLAAEPRALAVQVMPPRVLAAGRLLEMLPLEPAVVRAAGGRGRSDPTVAVLPAIPAGRYRVRVEGGGSGGMMMFGIGQDQFALRSEAVDLAGSADRDRVSGRRARAHRQGRRRPATSGPPRHRRAAGHRAGARASDQPRRPARGQVRRCVGVLSRRSQLRGAGRVLDRWEPAVGVRRAARRTTAVCRPAPAQCTDRESPDDRVRPVARGPDARAGRRAAGASAARPWSGRGARDGDDDGRVPSVGIDTRQPGREVLGGMGEDQGGNGHPLKADRPLRSTAL